MPSREPIDTCWECGEIIEGEKDWYPDLRTPPLDVDDCLCRGCAIGHATGQDERLEQKIEALNKQIMEWEKSDDPPCDRCGDRCCGCYAAEVDKIKATTPVESRGTMGYEKDASTKMQ